MESITFRNIKLLFLFSVITSGAMAVSSRGDCAQTFEGRLKAELGTAFLMNQIGINASSELPNLQPISTEGADDRVFESYHFPSPAGFVDLLVSRPAGVKKPVPVLFISAGYQTGKDVATLIPSPAIM